MKNPGSVGVLSALSVDNVIFGYQAGQLSILLVKHGTGKSQGQWGLPGDWPTELESLEQCAARSLFDRTGISHVALEQFHTFSAVDRYPGERVITTAFFTMIKQQSQTIKPSADELEARWFSLGEVPELIFDHRLILETGIAHMRNLARHQPIGVTLLSKKFTFLELQNLYEAVFDKTFNKPNFRRKFVSFKYLVDCGESVKSGKHRSAGLFKFDKQKYVSLTRQGFSFST